MNQAVTEKINYPAVVSYQPPRLFRHRHIHTLLASSPIRAFVSKHKCKRLLNASKTIAIDSHEGIRLQASVAQQARPNADMLILLHGWEGCSDSPYVLDLGQSFFDAGYSIVRLNFRDHGDTHHLNQQPFNSVRIDEVIDAIIDIHARYKPSTITLAGFSLGGNFVLRLAAHASIKALKLRFCLSVCPAVDPHHASNNITYGTPIYHNYFMKKWRRSLRKKYRYFPEIMRSPNDIRERKLNDMNNVFIPLHTEYDSVENYFAAYAINQDILDAIETPCSIIYAEDDPIINASNFSSLSSTNQVHILKQEYGGHCAFLDNLKLDSWLSCKTVEKLEKSHVALVTNEPQWKQQWPANAQTQPHATTLQDAH